MYQKLWINDDSEIFTKQRAAASLRHVLLQGKLGVLAARDPGDHGLCRATRQGDSFGQHSPLPVVPPFARWPFLSRQLSVWKCSLVAFCSWPWKCFASFYLPRLILFPAWKTLKWRFFVFISSGNKHNCITKHTSSLAQDLRLFPSFILKYEKITDLHKNKKPYIHIPTGIPWALQSVTQAGAATPV